MRWGFREVGTPIFEYYDDVYKQIDESLQGALVKLIERETGRIIVLRPDFTPQVARIASTLMKDVPRPLRLYYSGNIFRWPAETKQAAKQIDQIGLELIGLDKAEACAELVGISEEVLEELGVKDYVIAISNVSFIRELLAPIPVKKRKKVAFALARKDTKELNILLKDAELEKKRKELIKQLPELVGGPEILKDIESLYSDIGLEPHIQELKSVIFVLKSYGLMRNILIDLSEIRGMVYHRGFFFEVFVEGIGKRTAVGGRYDDLMRMYGSNEPGMGFAFNMESLYKAVHLKGKKPKVSTVDVLVVDMSPVKNRGVEIAKNLRRMGLKVARDIIERSLEESLDYAKKHGINRVVVIDERLKDRTVVRVLDTKKNYEEVVEESLLFSSSFWEAWEWKE